MTLINPIALGTISVVNGSTTATGSGTNWKSAGAKPGDLLAIKGSGDSWFTGNITSNTELEFPFPWPHASQSNVPFFIWPLELLNRTAENSTRIRVLLDQLEAGIDAGTLGGQAAAFFRNASHLNAGTIPQARLPMTALDSRRRGRRA